MLTFLKLKNEFLDTLRAMREQIKLLYLRLATKTGSICGRGTLGTRGELFTPASCVQLLKLLLVGRDKLRNSQ
jgi:hypothetical protein